VHFCAGHLPCDNTERTFMSLSFADMGLAAPLLRAVETLGFTNPTPVQLQTIPAALEGGDWMVSSQTGSGKTAAFLLPLLHHLIVENDAMQGNRAGTSAEATQEAAAPVDNSLEAQRDSRPGRNSWSKGGRAKSGGGRSNRQLCEPRLLVICPTRELAEQVSRDAIEFLKQTKGLRVAMVIGGMPFGQQIAALQGAQLVVATPGRLLDLENKRALRLDSVRALVIDEADRMLDLGFADDLEAIQDLTSSRDQTMMFSATFAPRIMQLAEAIMREPGRIEVGSAQEKHQDITQTLHWADSGAHKRKLLDHWVRDAAVEQMVVFVSTQIDSESLAEELLAEGHSVAAMHGAMPQFLRQRRIKGLREGTLRILVATDVAARGLDVPNISHVVNFGLPMKAEDYVHRIGRTGRAGKAGIAVTIADHRDRFKIREIERYTQQPIPIEEIVGLEPRLAAQKNSGKGERSGSGGKSRGGFSDRASSRGGFADRKESRGGFTDRNSSSDRSGGYMDRNRGFSDRDRSREGSADRPARTSAPSEQREFAPRTSFGDKRPFGDKQGFAAKGSFGEKRSFNDRAPLGGSKHGGFGEKRDFADKGAFAEKRNFGDKGNFGEKRSFGEKRTFGEKQGFADKSGFSEKRSFNDKGNFGEKRVFTEERTFSFSKPARPSKYATPTDPRSQRTTAAPPRGNRGGFGSPRIGTAPARGERPAQRPPVRGMR
jgi:superfamily II DNA/RNA helicase